VHRAEARREVVHAQRIGSARNARCRKCNSNTMAMPEQPAVLLTVTVPSCICRNEARAARNSNSGRISVRHLYILLLSKIIIRWKMQRTGRHRGELQRRVERRAHHRVRRHRPSICLQYRNVFRAHLGLLNFLKRGHGSQREHWISPPPMTQDQRS